MAKIDFKGTGEFARVNNIEAAIRFFEDYDIPYHYITRGENEGRIRVRSTSSDDEYINLANRFKITGCGWMVDHAEIFRDVNDNVIVCFSPYHMPSSINSATGRITYSAPTVDGYECEVRYPGIYGFGTVTAVYKRLW